MLQYLCIYIYIYIYIYTYIYVCVCEFITEETGIPYILEIKKVGEQASEGNDKTNTFF